MWSFTVTTPLAEGAHAVSASAVDAAGNMGQPATRDFTVDLSAPMVTITAPVAGQTVSDTSPTITGQAEPNSIVTIFIDGVEVGTAITDGQGTWGYDSLELTEGMHTVEARVTDAAGNVGSSGTVEFTVKVSAPVAIVTPVAGGAVTGPRVTVTGTGEPGATITVTVGGQTQTAVVGADGKWSVTFEDVPSGMTTIDAGDGSSTATVTFTVNEGDELDSRFVLTGTGGCAQAPGAPADAPLWLLALGAAALRRRRRA
jgi:MYXO-CTERM domain-containing protein